MKTHLFRVDGGYEILLTALLVQQGKAVVAGLLRLAHSEAICPVCSALFSGRLSLLIIMGADTDKLS